ncbi:MAG: class II aldolase/adducin family protein, partial [Gemmatimonadota bacterium]
MKPPIAELLIAAARRSMVLGLNQGTSGNISVRQADGGCLISPSGTRLDELQAADLVSLSLEGEPEPGRASSEWRLHRDIYRARPEVGAVLHTHSRFATTLACLRQELPAVHYLIAAAGTDVVRCSRYATFGTAALSEAA